MLNLVKSVNDLVEYLLMNSKSHDHKIYPDSPKDHRLIIIVGRLFHKMI